MSLLFNFQHAVVQQALCLSDVVWTRSQLLDAAKGMYTYTGILFILLNLVLIIDSSMVACTEATTIDASSNPGM